MNNPKILDLAALKSKDRLAKANSIFDGRGIRPDAVQSITSIRPFIHAIATGTHPQVKLGKAESLILIGLDSIKFDFANEIFTPDSLSCLTSVFPSTSICAWPSAVTGKSPEEFRSIGPVFYAREIDALYNALDDSYRTTSDFIVDPRVTNKYPMGSDDTVFTDLEGQGFQTVCINGFYAQKISRWSQGIQKDAGRIDISKSDWGQIVMRPDLIVNSIIEDVGNALSARHKGSKSFVWNLVDIDCYIHEHGYTGELKSALTRLNSYFGQLAAEGHTVVAFADHGQVPQKISSYTEGWNKIHTDEVVRMPSGGAGRVRWSYPHAGKEEELKEKIQALLGDSAMVIHRDELESLGILPLGENLKSQIGEIITFALTDDYPLAIHGGGFIYEHGSVTPDEMLVPLMVYQGAAKEVETRRPPQPKSRNQPAGRPVQSRKLIR